MKKSAINLPAAPCVKAREKPINKLAVYVSQARACENMASFYRLMHSIANNLAMKTPIWHGLINTSMLMAAGCSCKQPGLLPINGGFWLACSRGVASGIAVAQWRNHQKKLQIWRSNASSRGWRGSNSASKSYHQHGASVMASKAGGWRVAA